MRRPAKRTCFIPLCLLLLGVTRLGLVAQERPEDVGAWYMQFGQIGLHDHWSLHLENQWRAYDSGYDLEQSLNRWAVNYHVPETTLTLSLGYGYIYTEPILGPTPDDQGRVDEHRIYQQLLYIHRHKRLHFSHRVRLEERWVQSDNRWRFRYFLGLNIPINRPNMEKGAFYTSFYNELFANADQPWFGRNRVYGALGYVFNDHARSQLGFMRQIFSDWETSTDQVQLSLHWKF